MNNAKSHIVLVLILSLGISSLFGQKKDNGKNEFAEPTRQIHLDFHTSELIPDIGERFDKRQFQKALKVGKVNGINIFAKGHHGWSYYPTKVGKMHPHLDFDLLKAQIEACREIGVKVFAYFTVGYSAQDVAAHPEWAQLDRDGANDFRRRIKDLRPTDNFDGWDYLEPSGPYADLIVAQTEELIKNYDIDGVWYDIITPERVNFNAWAIEDYKKHDIDINDSLKVIERSNERYYEFFERTTKAIQKYKPDASIYWNGTTRTYNSMNVGLFKYEFYRYNTKHDLEDLPTAWGGYDIFPWRSKYFGNTGKDIVAMSGKFHKAWGEFGGFKHKDALLYEAATMVAFGASVNIGDQLHPSGEMDMGTYENIGYAFDYVQQIEDYGIGAKSLATTGLYIGEDLPAIEGTAEMLLENQVNFNVVNTLDDWSDIETLVITSGGVVEKDIARVKDFVKKGGKVLAMGEGILFDGKPLLDIGADYIGEAKYDIDYTIVTPEIDKDLVASPFLNYKAALRFKPRPGTEILAHIQEPYFSRTLEHYSSHQNTPNKLTNAEHPAVFKKGNIISIAHDLDRQYHTEGARMQRDVFINALNLIRTRPFVETKMPSMGRINALHQPEENRYVVHFTYASPVQKGNVKVIEDVVPIYDIPLSARFPKAIKKAYLIPSGETMKFEKKGDSVEMIIPKLQCHTAVVLEY